MHPTQVVEGNPCLEYVRLIVLPWFSSFEIKRQEANGGDKTYSSMEEIEADYASGALHPGAWKRRHMMHVPVIIVSHCSSCSLLLEYRKEMSNPCCSCKLAKKKNTCCFNAGDLKPSLARSLNHILQPVRDHFTNNAEAKELLKKVCGVAESQLSVYICIIIVCTAYMFTLCVQFC